MLVLACFHSALAADALPKNVVLADLGLHVVGLGYQRTLSSHVALQLAADAYTPWTQNINLLGLPGEATAGDTSGWVIRARPFVYPLGGGPTGVWVSPFFQAGVGSATRDGQREQGRLWAAGASVGYSWLMGHRVHIAFGVGGQYHVADFPGGADAPSFSRPYPTLDGSIGYLF